MEEKIQQQLHKIQELENTIKILIREKCESGDIGNSLNENIANPQYDVNIQQDTTIDFLMRNSELENPEVHPDLSSSELIQSIIKTLKDSFYQISDISHIIKITASSVLDNPYGAVNVINNAGTWLSTNEMNSWILFDFKNRSISMKSYSLVSGDESVKSGYKGPKSWKIEGSNVKPNDNSSDQFILIDYRNNNNDFNVGRLNHYLVNPSIHHMKFRYIKITQGDDGSWSNDHIFRLDSVEFFGTLNE